MNCNSEDHFHECCGRLMVPKKLYEESIKEFQIDTEILRDENTKLSSALNKLESEWIIKLQGLSDKEKR